MRILKVSFIIFLLFFIASFLFFKKEAIACEAINLVGFAEISPDVYVDSSLNNQQLLSLNDTINQAYDRVEQMYGATTSSARIIVTHHTDYIKFGLNPTGMQKSGFFRECVFLGPKGLNTDVIAHELVHAEVRYRTDFLVEHTELPAWFIEGTGIKVDYRAPFLIENIHVSQDDVDKIKSVFFFHQFSNTSVKSYQAARIAIEAFEPKKLYVGLERLNNGENFEEVFGL